MDLLIVTVITIIILIVWFIATNTVTLVLFGWKSLSKIITKSCEHHEPGQKFYLQFIFIHHAYRTRGFVTLILYPDGIQLKVPLISNCLARPLFVT